MELDEDPATSPTLWSIGGRLTLTTFYEKLPTDKMEAQRLTRHAKSFVLVEGELYK